MFSARPDATSPFTLWVTDGTNAGTVYATRNAGDSWDALAKHLPPIYSVRFAD